MIVVQLFTNNDDETMSSVKSDSGFMIRKKGNDFIERVIVEMGEVSSDDYEESDITIEEYDYEPPEEEEEETEPEEEEEETTQPTVEEIQSEIFATQVEILAEQEAQSEVLAEILANQVDIESEV